MDLKKIQWLLETLRVTAVPMGNRLMCQAVGNQEPKGTDRNRQELAGTDRNRQVASAGSKCKNRSNAAAAAWGGVWGEGEAPPRPMSSAELKSENRSNAISAELKSEKGGVWEGRVEIRK